MIYLLVGNNSYRALHKIQELRSAFLAKEGSALSLVELDGAECSFEDVLALCGSQSLFAPRRFLVLKHVFSFHPGLIKEAKSMASSSDIVVVWERGGKDFAAAEAILQSLATKAQTVEARTGKTLERWLEEEIKKQGLTMSKGIQQELLVRAGDSGEWALENELTIMALGGTQEQEEPQKEPRQKNTIFSFIDKLFQNTFHRALLVAHQALESGIEESELLRVILWKIKTLCMVVRGEGKKLNPYVLKKSLAEAEHFSLEMLLDAWMAGIVADSQLRREPKNGRIILEKFLVSLQK